MADLTKEDILRLAGDFPAIGAYIEYIGGEANIPSSITAADLVTAVGTANNLTYSSDGAFATLIDRFAREKDRVEQLNGIINDESVTDATVTAAVDAYTSLAADVDAATFENETRVNDNGSLTISFDNGSGVQTVMTLSGTDIAALGTAFAAGNADSISYDPQLVAAYNAFDSGSLTADKSNVESIAAAIEAVGHGMAGSVDDEIPDHAGVAVAAERIVAKATGADLGR